MKEKIGFIGMGNMASAMLEGMIKIFPAEQIVFSRADKKKGHILAEEKNVVFLESNQACVKQAKYLILAVKPQMFLQILQEIKEVLTEDHVVISIAAGITRKDIYEEVGEKIRVVRAMPNTPALLQEGMTGVCYQEECVSPEEKENIHKIFNSFGRMKLVKEELMNAVICASGSSPAYVYLFIEALADGVVKCGMSREMAYEMIAQTVVGAAKMVLESGEHPAILKDRVCSPKGTTIAGIAALEEYGFRNAILKATEKCYKRAEEMNKKEEEK